MGLFKFVYLPATDNIVNSKFKILKKSKQVSLFINFDLWIHFNLYFNELSKKVYT